MRYIHHLTALVALLVSLCVTPLSAQSSESKLLPASSLTPFTSIKVDGDIELTLVEGSTDNLYRIEYDLGDNEGARFRFSTKPSGVLVVSLSGKVQSLDPVKATLYYKSLQSVVVSFADVRFASPYRATLADFELLNGGRLSGPIDCLDLELSLTAQSRAELSGRAKYLTLSAQSNSEVELRRLNVTSAHITSSQGSIVAIKAGERLDVGASTKSVVRYWGNPMIFRERKSLIGGEVIQQ